MNENLEAVCLRSYNEDKKGGDKGTRGLFCPIDCKTCLNVNVNIQVQPREKKRLNFQGLYLSQMSTDFQKLHEVMRQNNSLQSETLNDCVALFVLKL